MNGKDIRDNPSLKKLSEEVSSFIRFRKIWPFLKPLARIFGIDTKSIDLSLDRAVELENQITEMTDIPDKFNDLFSNHGWIMFENMDINAAKEAMEIAEEIGVEQAEEYLADHFSPEWVEARMNLFKYCGGFQPRYDLLTKALRDYKEGRFYSSILVILSLMDGWVNELNILGFQRLGFFSEKSQLIAWDSIAAHPKGLMKLKEVFGRSRQMTRTDEITIPFRNGIVHGMDLGYDNKLVAAKCWAALFAVRDWALKAARNELDPPEIQPGVEMTLWESIENYNNSRVQFEKNKQWQPRCLSIGVDLPKKGSADEYPENSAERKIIEFLNYWMKKNYGYMASCCAQILGVQAVDIRQSFSSRRLVDYELLEVADRTPTAADIKVKIWTGDGDKVNEAQYEFRLVGSDPDGNLAYFQNDINLWGIYTWRQMH